MQPALGVLGIFCCILLKPLASSTGPTIVRSRIRNRLSQNQSQMRGRSRSTSFTREGFLGAAWSPDRQEIVFTTDISGRFNLWKVRSSGGWPTQITQSGERPCFDLLH